MNNQDPYTTTPVADLSINTIMEGQYSSSSPAEANGSPSQIPTPNSLVSAPQAPSTGANVDEQLVNMLSCRAQVCDRCRRLKKKCYGTSDKCNNCLISNQECMVTKTLKRKRKPKPTKLNPIEIENIKLKLKLHELESGAKVIKKEPNMDYTPFSRAEESRASLASSLANSLVTSRAQSPSNIEYYSSMIKNTLLDDAEYMQLLEEENLGISDYNDLPNINNYNASVIIGEYSIVDNFLQQDFIKILKEQREHINQYVQRFFEEINSLFPIIFDREYFVGKVDELMKSIDVLNFNANIINDEHNLCIVYKVILICMYYIEDQETRSGYYKISKHLLSQFEHLDPINALKCHLLTHLYGQMTNNRSIVVASNGICVSLAMNLQLHTKADNEMKRWLWFVICYFDYLINLDTPSMRLVNDALIDQTVPHQLIYVMTLEKKVLNDMVSISDAIERLQRLDCHTATFSESLITLHTQTMLIFFQRSLYYSTQDVKVLVKLNHLIEKYISIWHETVTRYGAVPFVPVTKVFQCALFSIWYQNKFMPKKSSMARAKLDVQVIHICLEVLSYYKHLPKVTQFIGRLSKYVTEPVSPPQTDDDLMTPYLNLDSYKTSAIDVFAHVDEVVQLKKEDTQVGF